MPPAARTSRRCVGWPGGPRAGVPLDALSAAELREVLLEVCASPRWVDEVAAAAPYGDVDTLLAAAELALAVLDERDLDDALAGHPRIGERVRQHASSALEQAGVGDDVRAALAAGNREYEAQVRPRLPGRAPAAAPARSCWRSSASG